MPDNFNSEEERKDELVVPKNISLYKQLLPGFAKRDLLYAVPIMLVVIIIGLLLALFLQKTFLLPLVFITAPIIAYSCTTRGANGLSLATEVLNYIKFIKSEKRLFYKKKFK